MKKAKRQPNYLTARECILEMIREEHYQPGEAIPSVTKLAQSLKTARISIQQAVKMLAQEGILNNIPGSGCYVKKLPAAGSNVQLPNHIDPEHNNYLAGPGSRTFRKTIKIGILSELGLYSAQWEKVFSDYMSRHEDIIIELVPIDNFFVLFDRRTLQEIDMLQLPAFLLPAFANSGSLLPLEDAGELKFSKDEFYDGFLNSTVYQGKTYGVPVIGAAVCQFYNKNYEHLVKNLFPLEGFWQYMEKLEFLSEQSDFSGLKSLLINSNSLFIFFLAVKAKIIPSYDEMKTFDDPAYLEFIRRFEKYFTAEKIFCPGIDVHSDYGIKEFSKGKAPILMGNTCWMSEIHSQCPFEWGIIPQSAEAEGAVQIATNLNAISAFTSYPEECLDILKYLASCEPQRFLAENGRLVANREACASLRAPGLDEPSRGNILLSLERSRMISTTDIHIDEYISMIINPEMKKWQRGQFSAAEFIAGLKRKTRFYYRGKQLREATHESLKLTDKLTANQLKGGVFDGSKRNMELVSS
ncbi:MAG: extracellular solute-binding protein [Victivallaceae bacterium]|nr:extracellular solute-binding protein [Victivallaceae bacterium]